MEDILASIRKILNEEEAAPADAAPDDAAGRPAGPGSGPPAEPETLELTEAMLVATPAAEAAEPAPMAMPAEPGTLPEAELPASMELQPERRSEPLQQPQPLPAPEPAQALAAPPPRPALPEAEGGLVAPATEAAAVALLGQLARSVAAERAAPIHRGGPTIEDVVREEVRPILKAWMDEHLPPLVERLVRAEIERVASRSLG
jgi:hypothetical protein